MSMRSGRGISPAARPPMPRLLITRPAYRRLQPHLASLAGLVCLVMDEQGVVRRDDAEDINGDPAPDCALVSNDYFGSAVAPHLRAALEKAPRLGWVQSVGAGTDNPIFVMLARKGVPISTNHGQADGMAEYVLWGVLDYFQGGKARAVDQAAHRWAKHPWREIGGTRWLIVGFGAIGQAVARRARAFGVDVTGVRREAVPSPFAGAVITPNQLRDRLGDCDVVLLCLPRTAATHGLVDAGFLAAMKPGSLLINVGRGSVIDEDALLAALDAGRPAHALLDVFRVEPLPGDSRFWDHPRVTLTAHSSALSTANEAKTDRVFLANLARYVAGEAPLDQVSPDQILAAQP